MLFQVSSEIISIAFSISEILMELGSIYWTIKWLS